MKEIFTFLFVLTVCEILIRFYWWKERRKSKKFFIEKYLNRGKTR